MPRKSIPFLAGLFLAGLPIAALANDRPPSLSPLTPLLKQASTALESVRRLEALEMYAAITGGSRMGPGDGWFHPAQGRYGWGWLAGRCDADGDGTVTRKEFPGPAALFDRLDRNRDGVLTAADFDWAGSSPPPAPPPPPPAAGWFKWIDTDGDGRISPQEWQDFFARAAGGKGFLLPGDLMAAVAPRPSRPPAGAPTPDVLLRGLVDGDLGSVFEGPRLNARAPAFALRTEDGKRTVRLSDYNGKTPVVLIFGSFT
jgi:hypothetical protein